MSVLVWIEQSKGGAVANAWEVLGKGRQLADALAHKADNLLLHDR